MGKKPYIISTFSGSKGELPSARRVGGSGGGGGGSVTAADLDDSFKDALLDCFSNVAWSTDDGQQYYDALEATLYPLDRITAVYTQSGTVYNTQSLDSLKADLVVTAFYQRGGSRTVTDYTLSGTLSEGTSTITVSYGGKTATFDVVVANAVDGWYYPFNGSLLSAGSEEFGFVGQGVYAQGFDQRQCYSHIIPTSGDATTDTQLGLKAVNLTRSPNLSGDFTISYWLATQVQGYQHAVWLAKPIGTTSLSGMVSNVAYTSPWTGTETSTTQEYAGFGVQGTTSGLLIFRLADGGATAGRQVRMTIPNGFDTTAWHHYAFTKKGTTLRVFVDGNLICAATLTTSAIYDAQQIAVTAPFNATNTDELNPVGNGVKMQDLYIAEFCKWESGFDPSEIVY